ncbi:MAG: hypothetical protein NT172_14955 [Planctomycetota bacterium]|nr:hypothetical protein [Planctomycetota bacterium]
MNKPILRTALLVLCLTGICNSAHASQCRHVDRLIMAKTSAVAWDQASPTTWEEPAIASGNSVRPTTCQDQAQSSSPRSIQPIVPDRSTGPFAWTRVQASFPISKSLIYQKLSQSPDPRPPRS